MRQVEKSEPFAQQHEKKLVNLPCPIALSHISWGWRFRATTKRCPLLRIWGGFFCMENLCLTWPVHPQTTVLSRSEWCPWVSTSFPSQCSPRGIYHAIHTYSPEPNYFFGGAIERKGIAVFQDWEQFLIPQIPFHSFLFCLLESHQIHQQHKVLNILFWEFYPISSLSHETTSLFWAFCSYFICCLFGLQDRALFLDHEVPWLEHKKNLLFLWCLRLPSYFHVNEDKGSTLVF